MLCLAISTHHITLRLLILSSKINPVEPECLCVLSVVSSSLSGLLNNHPKNTHVSP